MGISPRTLQRQLQVEGICFRQMIAETRFRAAIALLSRTDISIAEVAGRLGYSTPSGFSRAFATWAGCTPRAFRGAARLATYLARNGQK